MTRHIAARLRAQARRDEGLATAFTVIMAVALLAVTALVLDGGTAIAARIRAGDDAGDAARAGAQALNAAGMRAGAVPVLDTARAQAAARTYLASVGESGTVTATATTVTVTVVHTVPTKMLGIVGLRQLTVVGTATAHPVVGVTAPGR